MEVIAKSRLTGTEYVFAEVNDVSSPFVSVSSEKLYPRTWTVERKYVEFLQQPKLKRIQKIRARGKCILWEGWRNQNGYGRVMIDGHQFMVHRLAVALSGRHIPKGMVIDHLCRKPLCINPKHLEVVTIGENALRGEGLPAKNWKKIACKRGHLFTPENTRIREKGRRGCIQCQALHRNAKLN